MKVQVHFKDPDTLGDSIEYDMGHNGATCKKRAPDDPMRKVLTELFLRYANDGITVEFDTETGTAIAVPASA